MSRYFRISWRDRLRAALLGRVREVRADVDPVVSWSHYGGRTWSLDFDPFGAETPFNCLPSGMNRPTLVMLNAEWRKREACPTCGKAVHPERIPEGARRKA